jgi:hypothetical protein
MILIVIAILLALIASTLLLGHAFTVGAIVILGGTWLVWRLIRYLKSGGLGNLVDYIADHGALQTLAMVGFWSAVILVIHYVT